MKFHWVAGIAMWTIISGPAMYGSGPAPAAKQAAFAAKERQGREQVEDAAAQR